MNESPRCPKCDCPLPPDAPEGLCPKCLVKAGFESQPAPPRDPGPTLRSPVPSGFDPPSIEELAGRFPQLEILELLGKGGMGAVYKARQRGLDRLVALKILPPEIGHDESFAERFTREARALARLTHSHIVSIYDFGQADGLFFIVMEFVDGANLRQTMKTGMLTPAEALAIVPQICDALQFAHDEGIVHRDIKPENILIDKRGRVKIADFGLAKLRGTDAGDPALTATHQVMGTLRYMAPEQMQGSRTVDHRADIYSLGVVFYELLTGELPLGRFAPPSMRVQVDVRLDEIVLRALEQQPEQRYQHASDVKMDVERFKSKPEAATESLTPTPSPAPGASSAENPSAGIARVSLWAAVSGLVLPITFLLGGIVLSSYIHVPDGLVAVCFLLGAGLELVAIGCGIPARHVAPGKAGLIVGSVSLVLWLATLATIPTTVQTVRQSPESMIKQTGTSIPANTEMGTQQQSTSSARPSSSGWIMHSDGPGLTDVFGGVVLKLQPSQVEQVNEILRSVYTESLALEEQHIDAHTDDVGHLIVTIKPYPEAIAGLEDRLWSQLDMILSREQQSIARLNLKLESPEIRPPIAVSDIVQPGFFGWGTQGATLEIWRVGTWYHWTIQSQGFTHTSNAPELPEEYRRFWKEKATP